MPDRSGRICFCGAEGAQIVADKWVCQTHAKGTPTDIRCASCGHGKLVVRWEIPPSPIQIAGAGVPETHRMVTCSWCQHRSKMPESVLADVVAAAKAAEQKIQADQAAARAAAEVHAAEQRELARIAKEAADKAKAEAERNRLLHEHQRIQRELDRLAASMQIVESQGRHVEIPEDD